MAARVIFTIGYEQATLAGAGAEVLPDIRGCAFDLARVFGHSAPERRVNAGAKDSRETTMRKVLISIALASLTATATPVFAQAAPTAQSAGYSVETTLVGKLIDDPAAAAILQKHIPTVWANEMFQSAGRELTLKAIQQYETVLTDEKLAEIQAEFDKIPAKA